jgi:transcriptional regulator with XRE-family HTH domain
MPEILLSTPQYHYLESGLKNIYIAPAKIISCQICSMKRLQINNLELLHFTIIRAILLKNFALTGEELRFLREFGGYSIKSLSEIFHLEEITIINLENNQDSITPHFDLLIRLFYIKLLEEKSKEIFIQNLIEHLIKINFDTQDNSIVLIDLDTMPEYYSLQSAITTF